MAPLKTLALLFALITASSAKTQCFAKHSTTLAQTSSCGDKDAIAYYLSHLTSFDDEEIISCYTDAGCTFEEAQLETELTLQHCRELFINHDLKRVRRRDASSTADTETTAADAASTAATDAASTSVASTADASTSTSSTTTSTTSSTTSTSTSSSTTSTATGTVTTTDTASTATSTATSTASSSSASSTEVSSTTYSSGAVMSGTVCFLTTKTSTSACEVTTSNGHVKTGTCTPTEVETSTCSSNYICTTNSSGDICMEMQGIQTDGIIIAIVFAGVVIAFFGSVCFACMRDGKRQKAAAARAEAVALTRAATKRKRLAAANAGV